jgi:Sushi domain (SCR repeat).
VIKNGFVTDMSREYYFGDEARVQCYKGYKLTGSNIIRCGIGQEFLNPPKCEGEDPTYLNYVNGRMETVQMFEKFAVPCC